MKLQAELDAAAVAGQRGARLLSRELAGSKPIDTLALDAGLALKHHFTVMATDAM